MEVDQRENEALEVLHQVEEDCQTRGILGLLHLCVGADFARLQTHLPRANADYQLLLADLIWLGPLLILAFEDAALKHDASHLVNHSL